MSLSDLLECCKVYNLWLKCVVCVNNMSDSRMIESVFTALVSVSPHLSSAMMGQ